MAKIYQGQAKGKNKAIAVVVSEFNAIITERLLKGCLAELKKNGVPDKKIQVYWVPGSFELPVVALKLACKKTIDGVICLGAIVRGETAHFDLVAQAAMKGILETSIISGKPIIFGVLTTETLDQAYKRSEEKGDNKGRDAAVSVLQMADILSQI